MRYVGSLLMVVLVWGTLGMNHAFAQTDPIQFYAVLTPDEETTPIESKATGRADFNLERATLKLSWKVSYTGLSSEATSAHIYGPQRPGVNGGILFDLAPKSLKSPLEGSVVLTEGQLEYLMAGHLYVNILSAKFKTGELRGQIDRVPPGGVK